MGYPGLDGEQAPTEEWRCSDEGEETAAEEDQELQGQAKLYTEDRIFTGEGMRCCENLLKNSTRWLALHNLAHRMYIHVARNHQRMPVHRTKTREMAGNGE